MGRDKAYNGKSFKAAVDRYFKSITRTKKAQERVPTGKKDKDGHEIFEFRDILNDKKKPITYTEYVIPPSVTALCLFLGIHRDTFASYGNQEEFSDTVTRARGRIEAYLEEQLMTGKKVQGVIFQLKNNYGWKDQRELELGKETRESMAENLSLAEKMALIKSVVSEGEILQSQAPSE